MPERVRIDTEQARILRELWPTPISKADIAETMDKSHQWVSLAVRQLGLPPRPGNWSTIAAARQARKIEVKKKSVHVEWTEESDKQLLQMRQEHATWAACGQVIGGISAKTVKRRWLVLHGEDPRDSLRRTGSAGSRITEDGMRRVNDGALPAGHPTTWSVVTDTAPSLAGISF